MCNKTISGSAKPKIVIDNCRFRVTKWLFPKRGDDTGWHRHEYEYIVVPLFDGVLEIGTEGGHIEKSEVKESVPYFREACVEHNVVNGNDFECAFVDTELL